MPFPKDADALKAAGYKFDNDAVCRGCGDEIEWWISPSGKKMPMNPMKAGSEAAVNHFATCSDAPLFRK
jgi:hypothetical protein